MRKELYQDIITKLQGIDGQPIKTIDLWNENVYFIDQEEPFDMPAVFVEFAPVEWVIAKCCSKLSWRGNGKVRIHLVTKWNGSARAGSVEMDANLAYWGLMEQIHACLEGLTGANYHNLSLVQTMTNHNHEDLVETIDEYKVGFKRELTVNQ